MAATYTPGAEPRDMLRLLIPDTQVADAVYSDEELDALLAFEGGDVRLAAAQALDTIASSETMTLKVIRLLDLQTDGAAAGRELRQRAAALRSQARGPEAELGPAFGFASWDLNPWDLAPRAAPEGVERPSL
jgi:hypothetical protein